MIEEKFKEGKQSADIYELERALSNRIFQLLLQGLYLGVTLDEELTPNGITALIGFARLADMENINNVDPSIVEYIRETVWPILLHRRIG